MPRALPSLGATEAFLAAARASSFREGAAAIGLSPSAFSRRIQLLEAFFGQPLFHRLATQLTLTDAGERYLRDVEPALERVREASRALMMRRPSNRVIVAVSESFAVTWLMPRLAQLQREQDIEVELQLTRDPAILRSGAAHIGIWAAMSAIEGFSCEPLVDLDAVAVTASTMADGRRPPCALSELGQYRLLSARTPADSWSRWMGALGHEPDEQPTVTRFERLYLAYEAAANGIGVVLATPLVSERYIDNASIAACMPARASVGAAYQVVYGDAGHVHKSSVKALVSWLTREANESRAKFDRWCEIAPAV